MVYSFHLQSLNEWLIPSQSSVVSFADYHVTGFILHPMGTTCTMTNIVCLLVLKMIQSRVHNVGTDMFLLIFLLKLEVCNV